MGRGTWVLVAIVLAARSAAADAPPPSTAATSEPWKDGVSVEVQDRANALFAEANAAFAQGAHTRALELYRQASALWDHPLIHFNTAVTLVKLDRYLEAADALEHALKYGQAPFSAEAFRTVQENQRVVDGKLGTVEAACTQKDTEVLLDNRPWFTCPGTRSQRVLAGEHTVYADRKGALPRVHKVQVAARGTVKEAIELLPLDQAFVTTRRMPVWLPYVVIVGGAVASAVGLSTYKGGSDDVSTGRTALTIGCASGCSTEAALALTKSLDEGQARMDRGVLVMVTGGAVLATGIALAIFNQPQRRQRVLDVSASGTGATVTAGWQF